MFKTLHAHAKEGRTAVRPYGTVGLRIWRRNPVFPDSLDSCGVAVQAVEKRKF